jgi:hypothetical protein
LTAALPERLATGLSPEPPKRSFHFDVGAPPTRTDWFCSGCAG